MLGLLLLIATAVLAFTTHNTILQWLSVAAAAFLFLYVVLWTPFKRHEKLTSELEALRKANSQGLLIHSAIYGFGAAQEDVTHRIVAKLALPATAVNLQLTGCDPKPLSLKTLIIDFSFQGQRKTVTVEENQTLVLPPSTI